MSFFSRKGSKGDEARPSMPTLPPPPDSRKPPVFSAPHPIPARGELVFHCQLAHGSQTRDIKDFSSVKELYARIASAFDISPEDVFFCTLNTHKVDMTHLLGGQIGLEDFIFAHIKGREKEVSVTKSEVALGLTITDNGTGCAFVKRIKENSIISSIPEVCVGDVIVSLDGKNLVGTKHYEVAKMLKDYPQLTTFTMKLVEPMKAFDAIAPQRSRRSKTVPQFLEEKSSELEAAVSKEEGRATLKLKRNGKAVVEEVVPSWEAVAAEKIDRLLESFIGIRDLELAQQIVDLGKTATSVDDFALSMDTHLAEFEFPNEFILDAWTYIDSSRTSNKS